MPAIYVKALTHYLVDYFKLLIFIGKYDWQRLCSYSR